MKKYRLKVKDFLWFKEGDLIDENTEGFNASWLPYMGEVVATPTTPLDVNKDGKVDKKDLKESKKTTSSIRRALRGRRKR